MNSTILVKKLILAVAAMGAFGMSSAFAATTFVGSWQVDQGPEWGTAPIAYTGQEAAALLFGGVASDYVISTINNSVADIDRMAWSSIIYVGYGKFADNYKVASGNNQYLTWGDTSAYVRDNAIGSIFKNYAFRVSAVPEPETYAMLLAGLGLVGAMETNGCMIHSRRPGGAGFGGEGHSQ